MDRAKKLRISGKSIVLAIMLITMIGLLAFVGIMQVPDTAMADPQETHNHDGWTAWTTTTSLPTVAGNYYLDVDVTLSSIWNVPAGETGLCLNGHSITKTGDTGSVMYVGSGVLSIYECTATTHYYYINNDYVGVVVDTEAEAIAGNAERNGSFVGGYITGGKGNYSDNDYRCGGIFVDGGTVNLYGGTLIGNNPRANVGGVYVREGTLTVHDGAAIVGNVSHGEGGAICVQGNGNLVMDGGLIENNTSTSGGHGAGIAVVGRATVTGGKITGNLSLGSNGGGGISSATAPEKLLIGGNVEISGNLAEGYGGGIYNADWGWMYGGVSISGSPIITDNQAKHGGDVYVVDNLYVATSGNSYYTNGNELTITSQLTEDALIGITLQSGTGVFTSGWNTYIGSADPADYFVSDNAAYEAYLKNGEVCIGTPPHKHDGIIFEAWTSSGLPNTTGNWYLAADVSISDTWVVPTGTVNLCLCGHGIRMTGNNSVVTINAGATLKLYDCDTTTEHRYSLSNAKSKGAGFATVNDSLTSGYLTFKGGYVTGGRGRPINSWNRGGALYIEGAVEMYGGTLIGNGQYGTTHGGAFNTQGTGSFKMYGGSIQNNAAQCGGATRLQGSGSCEIYGGKIINNIVTNDGGAIHVGGEISVILQDCEISGNYAGNGPGAGIWMTTTGMVISGRTIITDNLTNSGESNVEIGNGYVIGVGELTDGATIGIKPQSGTGTFTSGWSDKMGDADPADYFVSDSGYEIVTINNGVHVHQHTYGDLIAQVDITCSKDGMAAHYHCAECGKYFDENKVKTS